MMLARFTPGVRGGLVSLLVLGAALRLVAMAYDPPLHPDEYFQYLEPAWWHLTGIGMAPWEFEDGVRSWLLPFYNGAWMALFLKLGVRAGAPVGWLVKAHWALINTLLVLLAFRGAASISRRLLRPRSLTSATSSANANGSQAGLLGAAACAVLPILVSFGGHTLSEMPSMLCTVAGLVFSSELVEADDIDSPATLRKAAWVGFLLSLGACLRIANGPLALVAPAWLLARGRRRQLGALLAAALVPALVFGLVDWLTWGSFASSFVAYIKFNFIEGKAAQFGVEPADWYVRGLARRTHWFALSLIVVPALIGLRATWPYVISGVGLLAYLSTQPHKEERFIIAFWPLMLIAAAGTLGAWLARLQQADDKATAPALADAATAKPRWQRYAPGLAVAWLALILAGSTKYMKGSDEWLPQHSRMRALAWVGKQPNMTGLIADTPYAGGAFWFSAQVPQFEFVPGLVDNPIITHALVEVGSGEERLARASNFVVIHRSGRYRVLRRR